MYLIEKERSSQNELDVQLIQIYQFRISFRFFRYRLTQSMEASMDTRIYTR